MKKLYPRLLNKNELQYYYIYDYNIELEYREIKGTKKIIILNTV